MKAISILVIAGTAQAAVGNRKLSFELIAGFEPATLVTSHNAIDLDQQAIMTLLANDDIDGAMGVYEQGAFSDPIAELTLTSPRPQLESDTKVTGLSNSNLLEVTGEIIENYPPELDESKIFVSYDTIEIQKHYVGCQVGANPNPNTDGCFAENGLLVVDGVSEPLTYEYDVNNDNRNGRTIQGFSTQAKLKMNDCHNCPYDDYKKFFDYYGLYDYADHWIQTAAMGGITNFLNGNHDFGGYSIDGQRQLIQKGTAYMSIFMYVIREMEDAYDDCTAPGPDNGLHAWDEAVAFYTGSLEGTSGGTGEGVLMHALADKRCQDFKTCGETGDSLEGKAYVNRRIFQLFKLGQNAFRNGYCEETRQIKELIVSLMQVPLIQGTLRYAHKQWTESDTSEKAEAEGAVFAAAVLPFVHYCSEKDAEIIYENMRALHPNPTDFRAVKAAFERNYDCMRILCSDVGGVWDSSLGYSSGNYATSASPCSGGNKINGESRNKQRLTIVIALGGCLFAFMVVMLTSRWCGGNSLVPPLHLEPKGSGHIPESAIIFSNDETADSDWQNGTDDIPEIS